MPPKAQRKTQDAVAPQQNKRKAKDTVGAKDESGSDEEADGDKTVIHEENGVVTYISNVMATAKLGQQLNLRYIAQHAKNCEFNVGSRKSTCIMRLRKPPVTAEIFNTGKIHVFGATSEQSARKVTRRLARIIQKLGYDIKLRSFKISNVVGICDVKFRIYVETFYEQLKEAKFFCPELQQGVSYRMEDPHCELTIHHTGRIVLKGASSEADIFSAVRKILPELVRFKHKDDHHPSHLLTNGGHVPTTVPYGAPTAAAQTYLSHTQAGGGDPAAAAAGGGDAAATCNYAAAAAPQPAAADLNAAGGGPAAGGGGDGQADGGGLSSWLDDFDVL